MQNQDYYKNLINEVIKKQIIILGPQIVLAKVKLVNGLQTDANGNVLGFSDDPSKITQDLINQFVQLSGEIVKKTMEPILNSNLHNSTNASNLNSTPTPPNPLSQPPLQQVVQTIPLKMNEDIPHPTQIDEQTQSIINQALDKG